MTLDDLLLILVLAGLAAILPLALVVIGIMDRGRIKGYFASRGGRLLSIRNAWFGKGWFGNNGGIYAVRYLDAAGNECEAACQTKLFGGVYLTDDRVVRAAKTLSSEPTPRERELQAEVERLREELERGRRGRM